MKTRRLVAEMWVPRPLDEVFAFFAAAENLDALTPPWLRFGIDSPTPVEMHPGALIDYRIRLRGVPLRWQSEITEWDPPHRFVDEQRRGPYRFWRHQHLFSSIDGGTAIRDDVEFLSPGRILEPLVHHLVVGRDVRAIFAYRQQKLVEIFGDVRSGADSRQPVLIV